MFIYSLCRSTSLLLVTKGQKQTQFSPNIWLKTKPVQILLSPLTQSQITLEEILYNYHTSQKKALRKIYNILSPIFISELISDPQKEMVARMATTS